MHICLILLYFLIFKPSYSISFSPATGFVGGFTEKAVQTADYAVIITKKSTIVDNFFFFDETSSNNPYFIKSQKLEPQNMILNFDHETSLINSETVTVHFDPSDPAATYDCSTVEVREKMYNFDCTGGSSPNICECLSTDNNFFHGPSYHVDCTVSGAPSYCSCLLTEAENIGFFSGSTVISTSTTCKIGRAHV